MATPLASGASTPLSTATSLGLGGGVPSELHPPVTTQNALLALQSLQEDPDPQAKKRANEWLSEFQHAPAAWTVCHELISSPVAPMAGRLLGAQTFKAKVTYDLAQLPPTQRIPLRDSFLSLLHSYSRASSPAGSRAVVIQLCIALAALAYQMPEWEDVVGTLIDGFGKDGEGVAVLLEFLKVLVEESGNARIPISAEQGRQRAESILSEQSEKIVQLLVMYLQAPGVTPTIQSACFETLRAWLRAGELDAGSIAATPLFNFAFDAIRSDALFEAAVDVICDLIHETQEVQDNVDVIQQIVPRVVGMRSMLDSAIGNDDAESVRGFARIFAEAGETYQVLLLRHPETFVPIAEALGQCAAYDDLDIVPITFSFWWQLSKALAEEEALENPQYAPYLKLYAQLQDDMIRHLQFPLDESSVTPAERDEFRSFRHYMGDTLKDCCAVLGAGVCMKRSYDLVTAAMGKPGGLVWQEIEAPLFSMRSMGARVDPNDDEVLPHIMDLLPRLPEHTKIRYAALLVISRYTEWINKHPQYLEFQLNYISAGFAITQDDVSSAAAQAMKFMCEDCREHLVPYLPQLHTFITTAANNLPIEDRLEVAEAIGHIISHMNPEAGAPALQNFTQPLLETMQAFAARPRASTSKEDAQPALDAMEQLESYLSVIGTFQPFPEPCKATAAAVYGILDQTLDQHHLSYTVTDKVCRVIRRGIAFFPYPVIHPILPQLLARLTRSFELSGHATYLWIIGKVAGLHGRMLNEMGLPAGNEVEVALSAALERATVQTQQLEAAQGAAAVPDVLEDYTQCLLQILARTPRLVLGSSQLLGAFDLVTHSLTLPALETIMSGLDVLATMSKAALEGADANGAFGAVLQQRAVNLVPQLLQGLVTTFPEESIRPVTDIIRDLCQIAPVEAPGWVSQGLQALPASILAEQDRAEVEAAFGKAFTERNLDQVRSAMTAFFRAARRMRERKERSRLG